MNLIDPFGLLDARGLVVGTGLIAVGFGLVNSGAGLVTAGGAASITIPGIGQVTGPAAVAIGWGELGAGLAAIAAGLKVTKDAFEDEKDDKDRAACL